jgi:hypothetical protein
MLRNVKGRVYVSLGPLDDGSNIETVLFGG